MDWLPGSDRLSDSDWWWDHAFDGIASSLLTASLAFAGIWLTLRHDRRLAREADLAATARRVRSRGDEVVDAIQEDQARSGGHGYPPDSRVWVALGTWNRELRELCSAMHSNGEEAWAEVLFGIARKPVAKSPEITGRPTVALVQTVDTLLQQRLSNPRGFKRKQRSAQNEADRMLERYRGKR